MSDLPADLAGIVNDGVDARELPPPEGFAEWVRAQIAAKTECVTTGSRTVHATDGCPHIGIAGGTLAGAVTEVHEVSEDMTTVYDLDELLEEIDDAPIV